MLLPRVTWMATEGRSYAISALLAVALLAVASGVVAYRRARLPWRTLQVGDALSIGPLGIGVRRASYLIDGGRRIRDSVLADFMIGKHKDFVRKAIELRSANPQ